MKKIGAKTRQEIINVAAELFAEKGYDATSTRQIATEAKVNLAAINYHFKSKEQLLHEVLKSGYDLLDNEINKSSVKSNLKTVDFCEQIFFILLKHRKALLNNMRIIFAKNSIDFNGCSQDKQMFGPPGGLKLREIIENEVEQKLSEEDLLWSVQMIFSIIVHQSTMLSTPYCQKNIVKKVFNKKSSVLRIRRTVQLMIDHLKKR